MAEVTEAEWSYLAGIVDGEGSIYIRSQRDRWLLGYPVLNISNTNPRLMEWIKSRFGGSLAAIKPSASTFRKRVLLHLSWTGKRMEPVLEGILPYLIIKRDQAELALAARKLVGKVGDNPVSSDVRAKREVLEEVMHILNSQDETINEEATT